LTPYNLHNPTLPANRSFSDFRYAGYSWKETERRVIAPRIETTRQGSGTRIVVTNLTGKPSWLYEVLIRASAASSRRGHDEVDYRLPQ
jgi:hypothetical protein